MGLIMQRATPAVERNPFNDSMGCVMDAMEWKGEGLEASKIEGAQQRLGPTTSTSPPSIYHNIIITNCLPLPGCW